MEISSYIFQTPYSQPFQIGRPDPTMIKAESEKIQEESDTQQQNTTETADTLEKEEQSALIIKSSAMYQNDSTSSATTMSVTDLAALSKAVQRPQNIAAYVSNIGDS